MADPVEADAAYALLTEEDSLLRAHWVAGAVEAAGIPTFVDEDNLVDEFAMSQRVLGLQRVRVLVPEDRLAEARLVFLNLSQPIPLMDDDEDDDELEDEPDEARSLVRGLWVVVVLFVATMGAIYLYARLRG